MKLLRQFLIILAISFVGEALKYLLPLPVPASIYGMVILFVGLLTGLIKLSWVKDAGKFLIAVMPVMFIPAGVGLMSSWGVLKPMLVPVLVVTVVAIITVMAVTGQASQIIIRENYAKHKEMRLILMNDFFRESLFAGVTLSLLSYFIGSVLKKKFKLGIFNPLLISIIITIIVLAVSGVDYDVYNQGARYLSWFLTPATVCLAIPLYEQWSLLKKNYKAVVVGIASGVLTSLTTVLVLSKIMNLSHAEYVTLLPKSITTAIGMGVSEELGGYVTITVAVIVVTGVLGNIFGELICKIFRIKEPIAKGLALGSAAHAIGTAKAMEMGEIEGAMSSLSIAVAGILTVVLSSVFAGFM